MDAAVEKFTKLVQRTLPKSSSNVDAPADRSGRWFIDLAAGKRALTVEYRPGNGFGMFRARSVFGEGPSEVYRTAELAARRAIQLLKTARASQSFTLKNLRELYEFTQEDLARKIGVKQAAISRFEKRGEVKLGTLSAAIKALGGELEIRARFPNAEIPLVLKE